MKKIILIISILVASILNAQVQSIGSTTINRGAKGDKGDMPSFTINGTTVTDGSTITVSSGAGSVFEFNITSESDLYNASNAGKIGVLTNDIALTANRTLADGLILKGDGGKITGSFILTCNNTSFTSNFKDKAILSDEIDLRGTFDLQNPVWFKWFGAIRDSESALYDNNRAGHNALRAVGYQGGTLIINNGTFYFSNVLANQFNNYNDGISYDEGRVLNDYVTMKGESLNAEVKALDSGLLNKYGLFYVSGDYATIENLTITGDVDVKATQGEGCAGIKAHEGKNVIIRNCIIQKFPGDGIDSLYPTGIRELYFSMEEGDIDASGVNSANSKYWRASAMFDLPDGTDGYLTGGSLGSYEGIRSYSAIIYYYDASGTFIGKTPRVTWYKRLQFPEGATQCKIVVPKAIEDTTTPNNIQIRAVKGPDRWIVDNNIIRWNFRNGISNLFQGTKMINNFFFQNGGIVGGPSYGIDQEDGYQLLNDVEISNNTFEDNWAGAITVPWGFNQRIINNTFNGFTSARPSDGICDVNVRYADDILIEGNQFHNTDVNLGRYSMFKNNHVYNASVSSAGIYSTIESNMFFNGRIANGIDANTAGGRALSKDNVFVVNREYDASENLFADDITSINDEVYFSWQTGANNMNISSLTATPNDSLYPTEIKGFKMNLNEGTIGFQFPKLDGQTIKYQNISDSEFKVGLKFGGGQDNDITLKNNNFFGWIEFSDLFNSKTAQRQINIVGGKIETDSTFTDNSYQILRSDAITIDLNFKDVKIYNNGASNNFTNFDHTGTVLFENCYFENPSLRTWDISAETCGNFTFIDCDFTNVTLTLGAGDKLLYTKSHPNLEVYADNTAALAGGIPVGYVYRTATGDIKTVY